MSVVRNMNQKIQTKLLEKHGQKYLNLFDFPDYPEHC